MTSMNNNPLNQVPMSCLLTLYTLPSFSCSSSSRVERQVLVMVVLVVEATAVEFAVRGNNYKGELLNSGVMFVSFRELFQILGAHSSLLFTATWCPLKGNALRHQGGVSG